MAGMGEALSLRWSSTGRHLEGTAPALQPQARPLPWSELHGPWPCHSQDVWPWEHLHHYESAFLVNKMLCCHSARLTRSLGLRTYGRSFLQGGRADRQP